MAKNCQGPKTVRVWKQIFFAERFFSGEALAAGNPLWIVKANNEARGKRLPKKSKRRSICCAVLTC